MFKLEEKTQVLCAGEIELPTGEFDQVQYVAVRFEKGKTPKRWKDFSDDESNWANLPPEEAQQMAEQLKNAILNGKVQDITLSFEPWGEDCFLSVDFDKGWAAILYNACDECAAAPCDPDRPDGLEDAPVDIGGQTPVPKLCGVEGLEKAARIVLYFLQTGKLSPETKWAVNMEGDLPWLFW